MLSVLIVEDGAFIRSVLVGVLRSLGVGRIQTAVNGAEAIQYLEDRKAALQPGTAPVDLVLSDLVMPEVDGLMLLRWIRFSPRSPDRFLPVLMLSGAADWHFVQQARDLGVTEFLAKPFTGQTIGNRILHAIARQRRFILAGGYFGPDRRRLVKPVQVECRSTRPEEILIVHSQSKPVGIDRYPVVHFDLPNRLGVKTGISSKGPIPTFSEEVLAAAEAEIQSRSGDYSTWIAGEVETLVRRVDRLLQEPDHVPGLMAEINRAAHEMRGQGGIFGYPLVTQIAKSLYEATSGAFTAVSTREQQLFKAHSDAIRAVMAGRISGDGGDVGKQLLASLDIAKKKYAKSGEAADGGA